MSLYAYIYLLLLDGLGLNKLGESVSLSHQLLVRFLSHEEHLIMGNRRKVSRGVRSEDTLLCVCHVSYSIPVATHIVLTSWHDGGSQRFHHSNIIRVAQHYLCRSFTSEKAETRTEKSWLPWFRRATAPAMSPMIRTPATVLPSARIISHTPVSH